MKTQLELSLDRCRNFNSAPRRRRLAGARWWFNQMHSVVERAFDWSASQGRPEQTYLVLAGGRRFKAKV